MAKNMEMLNDDALGQIGGGYMNMNYNTNVLTYTHEETQAVTTYQILDFEKAWKESNRMHAENYHEDQIIAYLKSNGYIA